MDFAVVHFLEAINIDPILDNPNRDLNFDQTWNKISLTRKSTEA